MDGWQRKKKGKSSEGGWERVLPPIHEGKMMEMKMERKSSGRRDDG